MVRKSAEQVMRAPGAKVSQLVADPIAYDGQTVRVIGEVDRVLDPRAIVLEDLGLLWAPDIPVVASTPMVVDGRLISEGDRVLVIGVLRARASSDEMPGFRSKHVGDGPIIAARVVRRAEK